MAKLRQIDIMLTPHRITMVHSGRLSDCPPFSPRRLHGIGKPTSLCRHPSRDGFDAVKEMNMSHRRLIHILLIASLSLLFVAGRTLAGEWATIKGQFIYDGEPPKPKTLTPNRDVDFCGKSR